MKLLSAIVGVSLGCLQLGVASGAPLLGRDINGQPVDATSPDAAFLYDPLSDKTTLLQKSLITNQFPGCSSGGGVPHLCAGAPMAGEDAGMARSAVHNLPFGGWVFPEIFVSCNPSSPPYPGFNHGVGYVCTPSEVWPYQSIFWATNSGPIIGTDRAFTTGGGSIYFATPLMIPMPFRYGDVSTVPTPATIALLGLGLVAISAARGKRA
jgi:hypothetical protein